MLNPTGEQEASLTVFGGSNLELEPTDLPQGLSPDCSDVAFIPGSVFTRPPLQRFSTLGTTAQIVYNTSFTKADGSIVQLAFDALGGMYADGVKIGQTAAGNRFHVTNAFGRAYIAISDGLHGADVPLQFDGVNLDRISQDGPGAPPSLANYAIPAVQLTAGAAGSPINIATATPASPEQVQVGSGYNDDPDGGRYQPPRYETYYTSLEIATATPHGLAAGQSVMVAGNTLYNPGVVYVSSIDSTTSFSISYYTQSTDVGTGGTVKPTAALLVRSNNEVAATTASPHNLRKGYRVNVSGVDDASLNIQSIVIDNSSLPSVATITTTTANGYVPGSEVKLSGITPGVTGANFVSYSTGDGQTLITMSAAHNLQVGDSLLISLGTAGGYGAIRAVSGVPSANTFSFVNPFPDGNGTVGSVMIPWLPTSGTTFSVVQTPSPNSFQVAVSQGNGMWASGTSSFAWDGSFYVDNVLSASSFTYSQPGPNDSTDASSGTVTPLGQIAPGQRRCVCIFQTRTGYLTIPSQKVTLNASGSQYLFVSNIPIGPPNVIARILAFTGANGGTFFYLPVAPQLNGMTLGTSTVVADNVTTSAVFDFADQSLFAGLAIGIPGNNLFRQVVLGPCLGTFAYAGRLAAWGERNKVQQFVNMGFEGGIYANAPTLPLGWVVQDGSGVLSPADYGMGFQFQTANSPISQPAYQDQYGAAILQPQTQYTARAFSTGPATCELYSPSSGVLAFATMPGLGFTEATFSAKTPTVIPPDTVMRWHSSVAGTVIDELEIIYTANPFLLSARVSYEDNSEAFDGVTGLVGPANDPQPVMAFNERRDVLSMLTFGPNGSLYEVEDTSSAEPVNWTVRHVAAKCGVISVWGVARFEDWFCWASDTGLRIFDGGTVDKMSQEVQTWWDSFNPAAKQFTVVANDPYTRRIYILAAINGANVTNSTWALDYRELNSAGALSSSGTLRVALSGKVITTDLTRKWSPWTVKANHCGVVSLASGSAVMTFAGGDGLSLSNPMHSAVYTLDEFRSGNSATVEPLGVDGCGVGVDADYGLFWETSTYPTYFFLSSEEAQAMKLSAHRLMHGFLTLNVDGIGAVFVIPMPNFVGNNMRPTRAVKITPNMARDLEFGLNVRSERVSYRVCVQPQAGNTQAGFRLSELTLALRDDPYAPVRGRNG